MGMALAAVADDGDLLAFDQVQVGVAIVINTHFSSPLLRPHGPDEWPRRMGRRYPLQLLVPRTRSSHNLPELSDANFGFKGGTSKNRFASVLIDSEVRTSVPLMPTNFGIGTLVSARGGDKPAVAGLAPRRHGARFRAAVELVAGAGDLGLVAQRPVA